MLCDCVQVDTVGNSYRYLGTPTFDGRYLGTLDIKGLEDLLYLRYPGTHTFDLERGTRYLRYTGTPTFDFRIKQGRP